MNTVISLDPKVTALNELMNGVAARIAMRKGVSTTDLVVSETDLVLAVQFDVRNNTYFFELFDNKGVALPFENRLSDKDVFLVHEISAYIMKADVVKEDYSTPLFPYTEKIVFEGAKDGVTEIDSLESFWHSKLTIERGTTKVMRDFRVRNLMQVAERQLKDGVYPTITESGYKLTRKPIFGGKDKVKITLEMGQLSEKTRALIVGNVDKDGKGTDNKNFAVLILRGFLIDEAADFMQK